MEQLYILLVVLIGSNFLSNKVEGLKVEKIIGGEVAKENQFKYVVAVIYKPRYGSMSDQIVCTGTIINDWYIATVAHCFYSKSTGGYLNKEFYVAFSVADLHNPLHMAGYVTVDLVIIPNIYDPLELDNHSTLGNLAIVRVKTNFGLRFGHKYLNKKMIPGNLYVHPNHTFVVCGYGWHEVELMTDEEHFIIHPKRFGKSDGKLRFANAAILDRSTCQKQIEDNVANGNMCVKIVQETHERKGICLGDSGSPLVRENYLVGIAINGSPECNENEKPGIYINVSGYKTFISNILSNRKTKNMRILQLQRKNGTEFQFVDVSSILDQNFNIINKELHEKVNPISGQHQNQAQNLNSDKKLRLL